MDAYWVEMVMFLKANFAHIPKLGNIPSIAFDVLTNLTPPTVDDMCDGI